KYTHSREHLALNSCHARRYSVLTHELVRRQITMMVEDVIITAREKLDRLAPQSPDAVRAAGETIVTFSGAMAEHERELKRFLYKDRKSTRLNSSHVKRYNAVICL